MKIAVTYENGKVFQHFGHTENFKVYQIENGVIVSSNVVNTNGKGHSALSALLGDIKVDAVICGGIGGGAINALAEQGIKVYGGVVGDCDVAVQQLLNNTLNYNPNVKCSHHEHEHNHTCGEHGCGKNCH